MVPIISGDRRNGLPLWIGEIQKERAMARAVDGLVLTALFDGPGWLLMTRCVDLSLSALLELLEKRK